MPDEIKSDPYVYRGFYCRACGRVFCPSCSNMQGEVCTGCGRRQLMPAYRPLLKRLGAQAEATSATPQPPSSPMEVWLDESKTVPGEQGIYCPHCRKGELTTEIGGSYEVKAFSGAPVRLWVKEGE